MKNLKRYLDILLLAGTALIVAVAIPRLLQPSSTPEERATSAETEFKAPPLPESWKVIKVADGDTITVVRGSVKEKVRFCGIDAPEVKHGNAPGQPLGQESRANLQRLIDEAGGEVLLSIVDRDHYGRSVAEVFTVLGNDKEKFLQEEQAQAGLAYYYAKYASSCPNRDAIAQAETVAKGSQVGVWSGSHEKPWDYRKHKR